ncbi:glycosyltransferase [uncultured Christiangramia sp.]|uniref:glycosyltransferase family 2 protein n=1 Tax=Christiangramia sp. 3-2217-3z TaxID=3417564 RepID=UPI002620F2FA|nr:glycosyltransferase [uncultured Christiangramia sp.]
MQDTRVTILITTKDRLHELKRSLSLLDQLFRKKVPVIICDDGSKDGTSHFLGANYPEINLIRNIESKGLIFSRNRLLNMVETDFAISLDDDSNFLSKQPVSQIINYFNTHQQCAVTSFRIYWSKNTPETTFTSVEPHRVRSFVGCGHAWRMKAWRDIPDYPAWFNFYGEEDFASYHLLKKNWEVHYLPSVLVQHRVNIKARKKEADYITRLRYSLRAGWFLYILFLPVHLIPRKLVYSVWMQLKLKVFKGDFKALRAIILALYDLLIHLPRIFANSKRLNRKEYQKYLGLNETRIYWNPEKIQVLTSNSTNVS